MIARLCGSFPYALILPAVMLLPLAGCGPENADVETSDAVEIPATNSDDSSEAAEVSVTIVDRKGYDQAIAEHKGKVVLVDYWATWCTECVEQFPHTVALSKQYSTDKLAVVSISFDDPDVKDSVIGYLTKQGAHFDNLLCETGASTASMDAFEIDGGLPWYVLYDRDGKVAYRFSDAASDPEKVEPTDQIDIRVRELVAAE